MVCAVSRNLQCIVRCLKNYLEKKGGLCYTESMLCIQRVGLINNVILYRDGTKRGNNSTNNSDG